MAFFTWKGFLKRLKEILPLFLKVQTVEVSHLAMVPGGAVSLSPLGKLTKGGPVQAVPPVQLVPIETGWEVSRTKIVALVVMMLGLARTVGDLTGRFHIPIGAEDSATHIISAGGELVVSLLVFLSGLGLHFLRGGQPPKVILPVDLKKVA